jgi:hypothetical protein
MCTKSRLEAATGGESALGSQLCARVTASNVRNASKKDGEGSGIGCALRTAPHGHSVNTTDGVELIFFILVLPESPSFPLFVDLTLTVSNLALFNPPHIALKTQLGHLSR